MRDDEEKLTLPEEIALLALDDEKGTFSEHADYAIAGAALTELIIRGHMAVVDRRVVISSPTPTNHALLDYTLRAVGASRRPRELSHWVGVLAQSGGVLRPMVIERLLDRRLIRRQERRALLIFRVQRFPERDGGLEDGVVARLQAVVRDGATPDARTAALVGLVDACSLWGGVLTRGELRAAKDRISALAKGDLVATGVAEAIAACQAAFIAAITVTTMAAN